MPPTERYLCVEVGHESFKSFPGTAALIGIMLGDKRTLLRQRRNASASLLVKPCCGWRIPTLQIGGVRMVVHLTDNPSTRLFAQTAEPLGAGKVNSLKIARSFANTL